jgi:N-ethylmaleimide reductase
VLHSLFSPARAGALELKNRIVMGPMTRNRAGPGNVPGAANATYYEQRAGAGLIVTEATQVSPQGVGYPGTPGIHTDEQVAGWRGVVDAVHAAGGRIVLQLWHVGRISHPSLQPDGALPVAPSAIQPVGQAITTTGLQPFVTPRALETTEIAGVVEQYRNGARRAKDAGFDGVEIHGANGYLIDQFLRDGSNRRTDRYGGSVANRIRFLVEVTEAVTAVWGAARVGVRISPLNPFNDMADSASDTLFRLVARELSRFGLAYLHVVESTERTFDFPALRAAFGGTYLACGGYTKALAEQALANERADLVAFATLFLANPDLPERFRRNAKLNEPDRATFYGGDGRGYIDYPFLTTE